MCVSAVRAGIDCLWRPASRYTRFTWRPSARTARNDVAQTLLSAASRLVSTLSLPACVQPAHIQPPLLLGKMASRQTRVSAPPRLQWLAEAHRATSRESGSPNLEAAHPRQVTLDLSG